MACEAKRAHSTQHTQSQSGKARERARVSEEKGAQAPREHTANEGARPLACRVEAEERGRKAARDCRVLAARDWDYRVLRLQGAETVGQRGARGARVARVA